MPEIRVVVGQPKPAGDDGRQAVRRAQVVVDGQLRKLYPLSRFHDSIRNAFGENPDPGLWLPCVVADGREPDVDSVRFAPDIDENPYNFVPWAGDRPTKAEEPQKATHDRVQPGRHCGRIAVTLTSATPIFVPAATLRESNESDAAADTMEFFQCGDGKRDRYAIPGSSVKGAVRSLFEAFTNSRAGVIDRAVLDHPPLYRRRAGGLFRIVSLSGNGTSGKVQEVEYKVGRHQSRGFDRTSSKISTKCYRANMYWVDHSAHKHHAKKIRYRDKGTAPIELDQTVVETFKSMRNNPHLKQHEKNAAKQHEKNAAKAPRPAYEPDKIPAYKSVRDRLFRLDIGDLIFGIVDRKTGKISCFGRHFNFLWPATDSIAGLMGNFVPRKLEESQLSGSDPAEATFGFAGTHGKKGHPFRGRVRFSTFWGPCTTDDGLASRETLRLMPLTAPSGAKAKSRPLYLAPDGGSTPPGLSDYHGPGRRPRLRGRKHYWHQKGAKDNIPDVHRFDAMKSGVPDEWEKKIGEQPTPLIKPLPARTDFEGEVHFRNLTGAELGALIVSLDPGLAFDEPSDGSDPPTYGIKLGKGKPRGLGSVTGCLKLHLEADPETLYEALDIKEFTTKEDDLGKFVDAYKKWIWDEFDFAKALKALLKLPDGLSACVYPPMFKMYGWLPKLGDRDGLPKGRRPKAMKRAHEVKR